MSPNISSARRAKPLAAVILLDQFPRNMFRDHADQYKTDPLALEASRKAAIEQGFDDELEPRERGFLYMPFMHSEDTRRPEAIAGSLRRPRRRLSAATPCAP